MYVWLLTLVIFVSQYLDVHLRFLAFILQEGALYLHWHRARDIWDCLVANPDACELDKEVLIIIIKICSAHISTLLGAQGAETEKTWMQTIYSYSKNKIMYRGTMQLQYTSSLKNCDIRWVLSSDLNLVILWHDLSLVGRWFQSLGATTEKGLSPQVRFEVGSFRSDMLLERKLREGV